MQRDIHIQSGEGQFEMKMNAIGNDIQTISGDNLLEGKIFNAIFGAEFNGDYWDGTSTSGSHTSILLRKAAISSSLIPELKKTVIKDLDFLENTFDVTVYILTLNTIFIEIVIDGEPTNYNYTVNL